MDDKIKEWSSFFDEVFREAKNIIYDQYTVEENGSGPPEILAVRKAIAARAREKKEGVMGMFLQSVWLLSLCLSCLLFRL